MKARYRVAGISFLVVLLVLIRFYEHFLFYDPLIVFYKSEYLHGHLPSLLRGKLLLFTAIRFLLNTLISLAIIYVAFLDKSIVKFSLLLYLILFAVCFSTYTFLIYTIENQNLMALFYVRRFLIHPVFVIILLPAFYYHRLKSRRLKRNNVNSANP